MAKITYANKETLYTNADIPANQKVQSSDMNEIKQVVNENDDKVGELNDLNTTEKSSIVNATNEVLGGLNGLITKSTSDVTGHITIGKIGIEWGIVSITLSGGYGAENVNFQNTYKNIPCAIACAGAGTSQITNVGTFSVTKTSCNVFMTGSTTTAKNCRYLIVGEIV